MPITREFINGRISFSVLIKNTKDITNLLARHRQFIKKYEKALSQAAFSKNQEMSFSAHQAMKKALSITLSAFFK